MNPIERRSVARVMVVEHDEASGRIISHSLRNERIQTQLIPYGTAAQCIRNWRPQLIVMGDDLDGNCGIELCAQMRQTTNAPIIIVTACDAVGHHIRAFNSGADDVVVRPLSPPLFMARILSHLRRAYRYTPEDEASLSTGSLQNGVLPVNSAASPLTIQSAKVLGSTATWPTCENCNYMGPAAQFEKRTPQGGLICICPSCGTGAHVRFALG